MTIRQCRPEDHDALKPIFRQVYPGNPLLLKRDYFDWQFRANPFNSTDGYTLWVLTAGTGIKGFYGWNPVELVHNGGRRRGCEPFLWWVDRSARMGGLELLDRMWETCSIRLCHDCSRDAVNLFSAYGLPLYLMKRVLFIIDLETVFRLFSIDDAAKAHPSLERKRYILYRKRLRGIRCIRRFQESDEMDFYAFPTVASHVRYTGAFLNWRYVDIPYHDYAIICSEDRKEFCVYRTEQIKGHDSSVIRILEWNFRYETGFDAMSYLLATVKDQNAVLADFFCSSPEILNGMKAYGFVADDEKPFDKICRLFRPIFRADPMITSVHMPDKQVDFDSWYISKGNSDMDRKKN